MIDWTQMEAEIQEKVAAKEAELHATYDERLRNYEERYESFVWVSVDFELIPPSLPCLEQSQRKRSSTSSDSCAIPTARVANDQRFKSSEIV